MSSQSAPYRLLAVCLLVLVVGASCAPPAEEDVTPTEEEAASSGLEPAVDKETLVIGTTDSATSLTPWTVSTDLEYAVLNSMLFDRLMEYEDGGATPTTSSGLAESYEVSDDLMTWTFKLREGIAFADGSPVDAEAVRFSLMNTKTTGGPIVYYVGPYIDGVEVVDDYTVRIRLNFPYAAFDKIVSLAIGGIYSPQAVRDMSDKAFQEQPVSVAPWQVESITPGDELVLVRNEDYWNKDRMPKLKRLIIRTIADPSAMRLALERGDIDMGFYYWLPSDQIELERDPRFNYARHETYYISQIQINGTVEPLDSRAVRQAIAHGIDRDGIINRIYDGTALKMNSPLHDMSINGQDVALEWPYEYDPDKARALLEDAGYGDGFSTEFWYTTGFGPREADIALLIQQDLAEIGIDLTLETGEFTALIEQWKDGAIPMWSARYVGGYLDPDPYIRDIYHSLAGFLGETHGASDPEVDRMLDEAVNTRDPEERARLYKEIQEIVSEKAVQIPMYVKPYSFIMKNGLEGFEPPQVFWDMRYPFENVSWAD